MLVVVENKAGAAGVLASDTVAKSQPNGSSLIMLTGAHATSAAINSKLPYQPIDDFSMISLLASYGLVVSVSANSSIKYIADLIAQEKAKPGVSTFASGGFGSAGHLIGELMNAEFGIGMVHVPMRAGSSQATEILAGRIDLVIESLAGTIPQVKAGNLRAIAVTSSKRETSLPDVPTLSETVPGVAFDSFNGLATAPGTPRDVIDALNQEVRFAVADPEIRKRMGHVGIDPTASSPEEMKKAFADAIATTNRIVDARKLQRQ